MALIKSISGIRGTIGGKPGENLTPIDLVKFTAAYTSYLQTEYKKQNLKIVVGRDARTSGPIVKRIVLGTLQSMGAEVIDIDLATTPTTEIAVTTENADGGIILTASHNPHQWNALKLLNKRGEFLDAQAGARVLELAEKEDFTFAEIDKVGEINSVINYEDIHIEQIIDLPLVDTDAIRKANFKIVIDAVNSVGGIAIPKLLKALGTEVVELFCEPTGDFPHNPEPLAEHLTDISAKVVEEKAQLGFVVDPDVDRLAIVNEDGSIFGEEYTLVTVAEYVLSHKVGNTVSNLSSSRALRDVTEKMGGAYQAAAVGEVNVVEKMKDTNAVIGGEGNGGVIYPALHYGRDALVGIALFLTHLAKSGKKCSEMRAKLPSYFMSKNKIELLPSINVDNILTVLEGKYRHEKVTNIDGVKIDFENEWVHLRKSNTEPIIRIYAESTSKENADALALRIINEIKSLI